MAGLLQVEGAPPAKPFKHVPLTTQTFFSGLITQRSPFNSMDTRYNTRFLGGRPDALIDGLNVELSNIGTIQRRPGFSAYSSVKLASSPLSFYAFHPISSSINPIQVIADTATTVSILTSTTNTVVLNKSTGAGQTFFQGVGATLYMGNGIDLKALVYGSTTTRNWGIAMNNTSNTTGPNLCSVGSDVAVTGGTAWVNPGNITVSDNVYATVNLAPPSAGNPVTAGPNSPGTAASTGTGKAWTNVNNIKANDGSSASAALFGGNLTSQQLQASNYGFFIPSNATILGITVLVVGHVNDINQDLSVNNVNILKAGVAAGTDQSGSVVTSGNNNTYGSSTNLWGTTWLPSDINNSGFGVELSVSTGSLAAAQVDYISIAVTYSSPSGGSTVTDYLEGTGFGFNLSLANTVSGILVEFSGLETLQPSGASLNIQLLKNGQPVGTAKTGITLGASNAVVSLGGSSDLWGTTWSPGDISSTSFGVAIQGINSSSGNAAWSIDFVRVTVYGTGGPTVTPTGVGTFTTVNGGYAYIYVYGNSNSTHISNPTPPSASTGNFSNKASVNVTVTASSDTQVNQIRVFRTKDGGSTYFELPSSPYPNTTQTISDSAADSSLQLLSFITSSPNLSWSPPPAGLINLSFHLGRVWGSVGNLVYFSAGPDNLLGNGSEAFPPGNAFVFPDVVTRLHAVATGMLVFTTSSVWIIQGSSLISFQAVPFQEGLGLLSWNALDVQGSYIFMYSSDKQFVALSASGVAELGYAIGDQLEDNYNPASVYVASLVSGSRDKAVYILDGASKWFRCNWNQPPEGGPAWSPQAVITGGATCISSVETSPGVHQLFVGQNDGTVLVRNRNTYSDNGSAFSAYATVGSLVLAQPGQIAEVQSITVELPKVGSLPSVSVLLDEISGNFESLVNAVDSPALLSASPSTSLYSKRFDLSQGGEPALCRHMQLKITFPVESFKNELLTLSVFGALHPEE